MKYKHKLYYTDEVNDEVVNFDISIKKIDKNYKYIHKNPFYKFGEFFMFHFFAKPIIWFYLKFNKIKIVNKKALKQCKKSSYFIYGNHTNQICDAFHPANTCSPKKPYIICSADNISNGLIGHIIRQCGAIPLPDTIDATRNFNTKIDQVISKNNPILIYPERHMWPYYTKIRPFDNKSFRYPVKYNKPIYTFTTTYQMRKIGKKPKLTIYVDGPFYPDSSLTANEQRQQLRDWAYTTMCNRAKSSNYEYYTYIKK